MGCGSSKSAATEVNRRETTRPIENKEFQLFALPTSEFKSEHEPPSQISQVDVLRQACVKAHNGKRSKHGAPPLTLSDDLNEMAQNWASHLGKTGKFEHSTGGTAGENLAGNSHLSIDSGEVITNMWYDEIKLYDFNNQGFSMATGHFTQVVWKSTTEIGVGMARNEKLGMYVFVANYRPPGNMMGAFEQNVQSPTE